ncbi:Leucine-rich repeat-containing protein 9 [Mactra antiquata]
MSVQTPRGNDNGTVAVQPSSSKSKNGLSREEEDEIMKEVCSNNGISFMKVINGGEDANRVDLLEVFFLGYPKMVGLNLFPNLRKLVIINQPLLQRIEGLQHIPKLNELWICECDIKRLEHFNHVKHLHKLYLYSNKIQVIENLENLTELEVLWLNHNQILNIENISKLSRLKQLNLAENRIEKIGHTLDSCHRLEELNLSGNKISSLRDLTNLMRLPSLQSLCLKDPLYSPAPVSLLCNYSTHVLYHLPSLCKLDTYDVTGKSMNEVAESTVMKKKMYYNMRIRTLFRNLAQVLSKMDNYQQQMLNFPHERLRALISSMKEIEQEDDHPQNDADNDRNNTRSPGEISGTELNLQKLNSSTNYNTKLAAIKERVNKWEKKCAEIETFYTDTVTRFKETANTLMNRMVVELESGGNVRFEEGSPSDMWFTSCHDLVLSRFCAADFRDHGIVGIKVRRIVRLHNRTLRARFDEKLMSIVDDAEGEYYISNRNVSYKKLLEYLFWMWDPSLPGGSNEPERILEEGFMDAENYLVSALNMDNSSCECSARQCEWYIFDNELVLPEYIVEFEYVTKLRPKSPFAQFNEVLLDNKDSICPSPHCQEEDKMVDSDVLNMEPQVKPRPRLIALTEELILKITGHEELEHITVLNLHGNGLCKLKPLQPLKSLKRLIVSFNELTKLDDLSHMGLEQIDASFNKISTLEGVKPDNLRLRIIGRLKSLTVLDRTNVTEGESSAALRVAAGSRISQVSLLTHSRTDHHRPRSLSLFSTAQILINTSRHKPEKVGDSDTHWYSKITALNLDNQHLTKISNIERLEHLRYASFNNNDITKIEGLDSCHKLEELSIEDNCICKLEGVNKLTNLRRLSLGQNFIESIDNCGLEYLERLHFLTLDNNKLTTIVGLQNVPSLVELYIGNNLITNIRDVFHLKGLVNLVILDMYGNPVASDNENYRMFVIYHLKTLKALDGTAIEAVEGNNAKDMFGGRLTPDFVAEKLGHSNFLEVREMDLPSSGIRIVDLGSGDVFLNLRSVNLEHNNLTSFSGLVNLPNLRVLCLNHNRIECVMPKQKQPNKQKMVHNNSSNSLRNGADLYNNDSNLTPVLENLEVLHLGYNCIKDMAALQLSRLTGLKALFLQGNEIQKVEGLENLHDLRELVLDRNKIKNLNEGSFINQWNLQELHMEENRLRELTYFNCLENLQRLYLGSNRVQEVGELENLDNLQSLIEISIVNNPAARRHLHRPLLVYRLKSLMVIDGIPVTEEERAKAELYFMDQQEVEMTWKANNQGLYDPSITNQGTSDGSLPGIGQYKAQIPVKVTNMQLATSPLWNGSIFYDDSATQDNGQRGGGRRRPKANGENGAPAPLGRTNTMYQQSGTSGYGGFAYTTSGNRAQFFLNQIPYVAAQSSQTAEYVEWLTRYNNIIESRMNNGRNNRK